MGILNFLTQKLKCLSNFHSILHCKTKFSIYIFHEIFAQHVFFPQAFFLIGNGKKYSIYFKIFVFVKVDLKLSLSGTLY